MEAELAEALPSDLREWALFIDIDGTLIDLAPTPTGIEIPADLPSQLLAVSQRSNGAMALVTGRSIEAVDAMFSPYQFVMAGMHGSEIRDVSGRIRRKQIDKSSLDPARSELGKLAGQWPGLIVEDKNLAIAVHYRQASEAESAVRSKMSAIHSMLGEDWKLQNGKMVVELHPSGSDKGTAISDFMGHQPFKGKKPLVIGDDLTDEAMFHYANGCGGRSVRVGDSLYVSAAEFKVGSAHDVRRWVASQAGR